MIHVLIIVYTFVISLNPAIKISSWAALDTNWRNALAEAQPSAATAFAADDDDFDTWQPVVQSQNWLITTASTAPLSLTSTQRRESERFSLMIQRQQQHQQYLPNRYYVYNHHNGNYTKKQMAPLSSASTSTTSEQSAPKTATIKLKPYVVTTKDAANANAANNVNINGNSNYRRYNPKKHFPGVEHHPYTAHISKDTDSQASQAERHVVDGSKHFKTDVNRPSQHPYQDNHRTIDRRLSHIPASATPTTKDTFTVTNVNLIDTAAPPTFNRDDEAANINEILLPLHAALDKVKQFCDIVKDLITDDNNGDEEDEGDTTGATGTSNEGDATEEAAGDDEDLSNEDGNDENDNELTNSNFAPVLAAVKVLLMKQPIASSAPSSYLVSKPVDEVQGHARDIDKGRLRDSLASSASIPQASPPSASSSEPVTARAFTAHKTSSRASLPSESPRLRIPKIKIRGRRKIKKIKKRLKKRFKKFLFPLLIAYKLKFLALIPLLIGGLTLLVGSTGMAGFFFALFAAVMTMRSGRGRSIVVRKY